MKTFKKYLNEASGFASGPVGENPNNLAGEVTDTLGPDLFSTPNLRRINAIIGAIGNMEYLIPEHAVEKLRNSLLNPSFKILNQSYSSDIQSGLTFVQIPSSFNIYYTPTGEIRFKDFNGRQGSCFDLVMLITGSTFITAINIINSNMN